MEPMDVDDPRPPGQMGGAQVRQLVPDVNAPNQAVPGNVLRRMGHQEMVPPGPDFVRNPFYRPPRVPGPAQQLPVGHQEAAMNPGRVRGSRQLANPPPLGPIHQGQRNVPAPVAPPPAAPQQGQLPAVPHLGQGNVPVPVGPPAPAPPPPQGLLAAAMNQVQPAAAAPRQLGNQLAPGLDHYLVNAPPLVTPNLEPQFFPFIPLPPVNRARYPEPDHTVILNRRRYVHQRLQNRKSSSQLQERILMIAIDVNVPGNGFKNRYDNAVASQSKMYYTVTYEGSEFWWDFQTDPRIFDGFDVFQMVIRMKITGVDHRDWLAAFSVYQILRTHLKLDTAPTGPNIEFIFPLDMSHLVTATIHKRWETVVPLLDQIHGWLQRGGFFCNGPCPLDCEFRGELFHYSLEGMEPLDRPGLAFRRPLSSFSVWAMDHNNHLLDHHTFASLFHPRSYVLGTRTVHEVLRDVFGQVTIDIEQISGWTTYVILVVIYTERPTAENLFRLWAIDGPQFYYYVGCTKELDFRHSHLRQGTDSPVSRILFNHQPNEIAVPFLAFSQRFDHFRDASHLEAALIEMQKVDEQMLLTEDLAIRYGRLNDNSEPAALYSVSDEMIQSMETFVVQQTPFNRFEGDMRPLILNHGDITGHYPVGVELDMP